MNNEHEVNSEKESSKKNINEQGPPLNDKVARMPHVSLPLPPKKGPHHPSQYVHIQPTPGLNFMSFFGLPMMSGTTASTPGENVTTPHIQQQQQQQQQQQSFTAAPLQLLAHPQQQAQQQQQAQRSGTSKGPKSTTTSTIQQRGKKKRGRPKKTRDKSGFIRKHSSRTLGLSILDDDPKRLINPLLDIPYVDSQSIPQASDLLVHSSLAFCKPDTFSLAHYARLLGFDVHSKKFVHHVSSLPLLFNNNTTDPIYTIPPLGTWFSQCMPTRDSLHYTDFLYETLQQQQHQNLTATNSIPKITRELQQQVLREVNVSINNINIHSKVTSEGLFTVKLGSTEITYDFSWFPLGNGISELVLHVHRVVVDDDNVQHPRELLLVLVCLVLQHARSFHVWYGVWDYVPSDLQDFMERYFGMTVVLAHYKRKESDASTAQLAKSLYQAAATLSPRKYNAEENTDAAVTTTADTLGEANFLSHSTISLLCDLHKSSSRYAGMLFRQQQQKQKKPTIKTRQRMLVRLPTVEQAIGVQAVRSNKNKPTITSSAKESVRSVSFGIRLTSDKMQLLNGDGKVVEGAVHVATTMRKGVVSALASVPAALVSTAASAAASVPPTAAPQTPMGATKPSPVAFVPAASATQAATLPPTPTAASSNPPSWDVFKIFAQVVPTATTEREVDDEILRDLKAKQAELAALEGGMEPKVRSLLQQVVDVRMDYEKDAEKRQEEQKLLKAYGKILDRRKEIDTAWQKQLEQDMDAVCEICMDGEVTPDNQILFCEACNVAVHQMCYGIDEVPEGDYYCIACRYLGRDKMSKALSQRGGDVKRVAPSPLPICCELCPRKQGAFVRSDTSSLETKNADGTINSVLSKWVHVVCAKWQGLNFVPLGQTNVVEDVQGLKRDFMRHGKSCILCLGRRGAYIKCRQENCDSWMHVTCARATGLCEVSHGENCHGDVESNPWTLLCPEHSTIDPATVHDRVSIEQLVRSAEEFPPEPYVESLKARPTKVFNKMTGKERSKFLADPGYEQDLLDELSKKLHGVHCEVCHQFEEDGKNLKKCVGCSVVFCSSCVLPVDVDPDEREYKCPACKYAEEMQKTGGEYEVPQCTMCFQKGGWLREAYAEPVNRKAYWRLNPAEYEETLFAKDLWCHAICTM